MARPKNSAEYWKWRQARRMFEQMNDADKVGEDISRLYAAASRQLTNEIEKIFFKYQQKWGLSKAVAKRLLSKVRGKKTVDVLKAMLPYVDEDVREEFRAQIESGAYAARIKRLEELRDNLGTVMAEVYRQDEQRQREHYVQFAEESYNREIYEIQKQVGFQFEFNDISEEAIDMVLNRKWCGESFSDAIWKNTQKVADEVRDVLLIELMTGQCQEDAARAIAEQFRVGAMQSRRIVRTESNYISGQVQLQAYEECGADKYIYVATLDSRTDEECGMLDGKVFFVKDQQPGVNMHPMHPNCRCTTTIALDKDTLAGLKRRARDPETGEVKEVLATMTWQEWRKQNVATINATPRAQLIPPAQTDDPARRKRAEKIAKRLKIRTVSRFRAESLMDENVKVVGKLKRETLGKLSNVPDIDGVVLTRERLARIFEGHTEAAGIIYENLSSIVNDPDYVLQDSKRANTVIAIKKVDDKYLSVVLRIHTADDAAGLSNSVLTGWYYPEKKIEKVLTKNKENILYKKSDN